MDQLHEAIRLTKDRIKVLELELRRENDFLERLSPTIKNFVKGASKSRHWTDILNAIAVKPLKFEHVCDYVDSQLWSLSRPAIRAGLYYQVKRGNLDRSNDGLFSLTKQGQDFLIN